MRAYARRARDNVLISRALTALFKSLKARGTHIPAGIYQRLPHSESFVVRCPGGGEFRMASRGEWVEKAVEWEGAFGHEPECIQPWLELASSSRVVLDVGANTGLYSLLAAAASPDATIHAFEPVARVAERARRNAALNPQYDITVHQCAAGAHTGTADIHDPGGETPYGASLHSEDWAGPTGTTYAVDVVSVDEFAEAHHLPTVDLVKLDVEGFEAAALEGMRQTIDRSRPAIMMEFLDEDDRAVVAQLEDLMGRGYALYHLDRDGVRRSPTATRPPHGMNVLLVPRERSLRTTPLSR